MAVLPQFGGLADALMMRDAGGALLLSAGAGGGKGGYFQQQYNNCSGAQSELTCNNNGGGVALPSRKRGREAAGMESHYGVGVSTSSALLLPVPGMHQHKEEVVLSPPDMAGRTMHTGLASTSGRPPAAESSAASVTDALASELHRQGLELDALVRAECERLRSGLLAHACKRQREAVARAVVGAAARQLRQAEKELVAARRRNAELEERVRQAAAESQAWCGLARSHEAAAAGLRATLEQVLLLRGGGCGVVPVVEEEEGFGESDGPSGPSDAQSTCFEAAAAAVDTATTAGKWACKACGEGEATVLVLPCRHLALCKACEPRLDCCPVCLAVKNASIHVAPANR